MLFQAMKWYSLPINLALLYSTLVTSFAEYCAIIFGPEPIVCLASCLWKVMIERLGYYKVVLNELYRKVNSSPHDKL